MRKVLLKKSLKLFLVNSRSICSLVLVVILLSSCKTIPIGFTSKEKTFNDFLFNRYEYSDNKYFSCEQIDLTLLGPNSKSIKAKVNIHKGEFIFANISILGFELGRAEISIDSVKIINRISKSYYFNSIENFNNLFNLGLTYLEFESLLLKGFSVEKGLNKKKFISHIIENDSSYLFSSDNSRNVQINSYYTKDIYLQSNLEILQHPNDSLLLKAVIISYQNEGTYPKFITVNLTEMDYTANIEVSIGKILYDKFSKKSFEINSKYREIEF